MAALVQLCVMVGLETSCVRAYSARRGPGAFSSASEDRACGRSEESRRITLHYPEGDKSEGGGRGRGLGGVAGLGLGAGG